MTLSCSVVMPTYNGARFIAEMLGSIASQTVLPQQLVLSDDASKDDTLAVARRFAETAPFAVDIVGHTPSGPTRNYLNAVSLASGDIVIVADQDDIWKPGRVAALLAEFEAHPGTALVSADSELVDAGGRSLQRTLRGGAGASLKLAHEVNDGNDLAAYLRGATPLLAHTMAFREELKPPLLKKLEGIEGWWFEEWLADVGLCHGRLRLVPEALTLYRQHAQQAAGAPKMTGVAAAMRESSYSSRSEKIAYCIDLARRAGRQDRADVFARYLDFLGKREAALASSALAGSMKALGLLAGGHYGAFARGILSCGKDIVSVVRRDRRRA